MPLGEGRLQGSDIRGTDPASGSLADCPRTHLGPVVPAQQLWLKLQALHEIGYEGMETEKMLEVVRGLIDSLV